MRRTSLALAMAYPATAIAQNPPVQQATGMIAGVVRDRATKQPIEGVQVFVQGGAYGTITKANGAYTIIGVPTGTYTVVARIVGYPPVETTNVVVRADVRRELNVEMQSLDYQVQVQYEPATVAMRDITAHVTTVSCPASPGARFGINGLQAASLSWRRIGTETIYSFQSEPVVVEVESWSALKPGDVILSVNGEPITTRGGADYFGNPPAGSDIVIAVRRNGERMEVVAPTCTEDPLRARVPTQRSPGGGVAGASPGRATTEPVRVRGSRGGSVRPGAQVGGSAGGVSAGVAAGGVAVGGGSAGGGVAAGGIAATPAPQRPVPIPADIVNDSLSEAVALADFGVVLSCATACYRARDRAGTIYWRFIDPPVVRTLPLPNPRQMTDADWPVLDAIRRGRAAGLHEGVVIERVNGQAAASEAGSRMLTFPAEYYPLNLDIRYSGRTQRITLKAPDGAR